MSMITGALTLALAGILLSPSANATQRACSAPQWAGNPGMNGNGRLEATLFSACRIQLDSQGSIATLNQNLQNSLMSENQIHRGPENASHLGMPAVYFDMTTKITEENGDKSVIRKDVHVASNQTNHLVYDFHSTHITGSGNAALLKLVKYKQEITKESEASIRLVVTQTVELEKPWYAPKDIFISQAKKALLASFTKGMQIDSATVAKQYTGRN